MLFEQGNRVAYGLKLCLGLSKSQWDCRWSLSCAVLIPEFTLLLSVLEGLVKITHRGSRPDILLCELLEPSSLGPREVVAFAVAGDRDLGAFRAGRRPVLNVPLEGFIKPWPAGRVDVACTLNQTLDAVGVSVTSVCGAKLQVYRPQR